MNSTFSGRKGVTPVVAIVMLLMLTIAVVGGAAVFIDEYIGQVLTEFDQQSRADITIRDVTCTDSNPDQITWVVDNTGDIDVDLSQSEVFLRRLRDDKFLEQLEHGEDRLLRPTDSLWRPTLNNNGNGFSHDLQRGEIYRVVFEFDKISGSRARKCTA